MVCDPLPSRDRLGYASPPIPAPAGCLLSPGRFPTGAKWRQPRRPACGSGTVKWVLNTGFDDVITWKRFPYCWTCVRGSNAETSSLLAWTKLSNKKSNCRWLKAPSCPCDVTATNHQKVAIVSTVYTNEICTWFCFVLVGIDCRSVWTHVIFSYNFPRAIELILKDLWRQDTAKGELGLLCLVVDSYRGSFYKYGLTLFLAWISNHMLSKVWDEISDPFPNFNGCTV